MGIFRIQKDSNYVVMNKTALQDDRLSWKAKGLHAYMLSMPDDWVFYDTELQKHAKDGVDSLKSAIKELKTFGYMKRERINNGEGKFQWETIVFETPYTEKPSMVKPSVVKPLVEKPSMENPTLLSNKELSIDELNNNLPSNDKDNVTVVPFIPHSEIVEYLNLKAGTKYKTSSKKTQTLIKTRFSEGFELDDFKTVIDKKAAEWLTDSKMNQYLRPETLFGTKFESYLNQKGGGQSGTNTRSFTPASRTNGRQYSIEVPEFDYKQR